MDCETTVTVSIGHFFGHYFAEIKILENERRKLKQRKKRRKSVKRFRIKKNSILK